MVDRSDGRPYQVAQVDPALCTSCGICAGSCAPMGIGPAGRTGKDQLALARAFAKAHPGGGGIVIIACRQAGGLATRAELDGAPVFTVSCSGNLHTSVVEFFVRSGADGVLVVGCPPRDCWNREGPVWLEQRLYHDREAELLPRVDKRRVRLVHAGAAEQGLVRTALRSFQSDVEALQTAGREAEPDLSRECEAVESGASLAGGAELSR